MALSYGLVFSITPAHPQDWTEILDVSELVMDSLLFEGAEVRIAGQQVGSRYDGIYRAYTGPYVTTVQEESQLRSRIYRVGQELLAEAGYPARADSARARPGAARFILGGEVKGLVFNEYGPQAGNRQDISVTIEWKVRDRWKGDEIYRRTHTGHAENGPRAVQKALRGLFADSRFVRALANRTEGHPVPIATRIAWRYSAPRTPDAEEPIAGGSATIVISRADLSPARGGSVFDRNAPAVVALIGSDGSVGSAFIITKDGLALTNAHVVDEASSLAAMDLDEKLRPAEVVRIHDRLDAALIAIDCEGECQTVQLGNSDDVFVGDDVYLMGSPRALTHSLTKGIVSGFRKFDDWTLVQTDAAISPGSSGGPMIDSGSGRVVGIVTLKSVAPEDEGLGFAIPIEDALLSLGIEYFLNE